MQPFSAKQLYIMNGGNKRYIYSDGFGDVYEATPEEEAAWAREVIAAALAKIDTSESTIELKSALENLRFHKYEGLDALILSKLEYTSPARRVAFATALWNTAHYEKSVVIIYQHLLLNRHEWVTDVFPEVYDFKSNAAKLFILICLEGDDDGLFMKATITMGKWANSGLPALRQNNLLEILQPENKHLPTFSTAVEQLKSILQINNKA